MRSVALALTLTLMWVAAASATPATPGESFEQHEADHAAIDHANAAEARRMARLSPQQGDVRLR